jgi:hypothetical protein
VTTLKSSLESEKVRAAKQQALASAAVQAANKRASHFEALYESAKADASEERRRVEAYRSAAADLSRQLEYNGPEARPRPPVLTPSSPALTHAAPQGAIPLSLLMPTESARPARRSLNNPKSPKRQTTSPGAWAAPGKPAAPGTPSPAKSVPAAKAAPGLSKSMSLKPAGLLPKAPAPPAAGLEAKRPSLAAAPAAAGAEK